MPQSHFFDCLKAHFKANLPCVVYRKPNSKSINAILQKNNNVHKVKNFTEVGFVFAPFDNQNTSIVLPLKYSNQLSLNQFETTLPSNPSKLIDISISETEKKEYINLISKTLAAIQTKALKKVVISRCVRFKAQQLNALETFKKLLHLYPKAFVYCWYHPKIGLWLGATPETLSQFQGKRFLTMSLAGTQVYKNNDNVVWQAKEEKEQQIVTDYILETLNNSVSNLKALPVKTVKAGNVMHLQSTITGTLIDKESIKTVIQKLHPTPAVCGYPKQPAKQFILKNEPYDRAFYTGFLGELNFKVKHTRNPNKRNVEHNAYHVIKVESNLFVNLRCMEFKDDTALVYVGGGVTSDSKPEQEWEETQNKLQTMGRVLTL